MASRLVAPPSGPVPPPGAAPPGRRRRRRWLRGLTPWSVAPPRVTRVPILMYHRLTPAREAHPFSMVVGRFRAQLGLLRALGYRSVSPGEIAQATRCGTPLAGRSIVITFDDGYLDTYTLALPALRDFGFTATCFLVADRVGRTSDWTEPARLMDWPEVREWLAAGMAIGSHSLNHRDLTTLPAPELGEEVEVSRARLEERLGIPVRSFAYPFNRLGGRELEAVAVAGYEAACAGPEIHGSVFALTRVGGASDSLTWFLVQLLPVYPELRHLYGALTGRDAAPPAVRAGRLPRAS